MFLDNIKNERKFRRPGLLSRQNKKQKSDKIRKQVY